jgi:hypothetical protein
MTEHNCTWGGVLGICFSLGSENGTALEYSYIYPPTYCCRELNRILFNLDTGPLGGLNGILRESNQNISSASAADKKAR